MEELHVHKYPGTTDVLRQLIEEKGMSPYVIEDILSCLFCIIH